MSLQKDLDAALKRKRPRKKAKKKAKRKAKRKPRSLAAKRRAMQIAVFGAPLPRKRKKAKRKAAKRKPAKRKPKKKAKKRAKKKTARKGPLTGAAKKKFLARMAAGRRKAKRS